MTVLVTGATGFLGPYLSEAFAVLGDVTGTSRRSRTHACDLTDEAAVERLLKETNPRVVVHAAALADVDECERRPADAALLNGHVSMMLAQLIPQDVSLVYISTDQVYPSSGAPHAEGAEAPVNVYGLSKLVGEAAISVHPKTLVMRTNIFGLSRSGGSSLVDFLVNGLSRAQPVTLYDDVLFSPLHAATLGQLAVECMRREIFGVFNFGCRDGMSKAQFALELARHLKLPTGSARRGASTNQPARAPRPLDMRLDVSKIEARLSRHLPNLRDEIQKLK